MFRFRLLAHRAGLTLDIVMAYTVIFVQKGF